MKGLLIIALVNLILPLHAAPDVWVEIHDVSPSYGTEELSKVVEVLEKHDVDRVVIFVIPSHGGSAPLSEHPEFSDYLKELESRGYEIGAHGYTHRRHEFYRPKDEVIKLLNQSMTEFHAAGFDPQVFLPPRFLLNDEGLKVIEENFEETYLIHKVLKDGKSLRYFYHEFTWSHYPEWIVMPVAKASYLSSRSDVYRLSVHIDRMDNERLEFLDDFLDFTDVKNA